MKYYRIAEFKEPRVDIPNIHLDNQAPTWTFNTVMLGTTQICILQYYRQSLTYMLPRT